MLYNLRPLNSTKLKKQNITSTMDSCPVITPSQCSISHPKFHQYPDFQHHRWDLSVFEVYINRMKKYAVLRCWLLAFNIMRLLCGALCIWNSVISTAALSSLGWVFYHLAIHSTVGRPLSCFHVTQLRSGYLLHDGPISQVARCRGKDSWLTEMTRD